jgi:hypothetical protein
MYIPLFIIMFAGVLAINAQAQTKVIADVPFAFTAGKTTLPAGRYTITVLNPSSDRKVLQIRSLDGRSSVIVLTTEIIGPTTDDAKLVFERYGDRYVFARAHLAGDQSTLVVVVGN